MAETLRKEIGRVACVALCGVLGVYEGNKVIEEIEKLDEWSEEMLLERGRKLVASAELLLSACECVKRYEYLLLLLLLLLLLIFVLH
jgi:hypothetical protein